MPAPPAIFRALLVLLLPACIGASASEPPAESLPDPTAPAWGLRGFGSLVATRTSDDASGYVRYPQNLTQATHDSWSLKNDSLFGLQLDVQPQAPWSATVQVLSRNRARNKVETQVEWAFVRYRHSDEWLLQVGRLLSPVLTHADSRFVGHANLGVRPNLDTYNIYPLSNHDGVNLIHQREVAGWHMQLTAFGGRSTIELPSNDGGTVTHQYKADFVRGLTAQFEQGGLNWRLAYTHADAYIKSPAGSILPRLLDEARRAQANGCGSCGHAVTALRNITSDTNNRTLNASVHQELTPFAWWFEYAGSRANESLRASYDTYLLGASVRWGMWSPYVNTSRTKLKSLNARRISDQDFASASPLLRAYHRAGLFPSDASRKQHVLGLRADVHPQVALKAEVMHVRFDHPQSAVAFSYPKLSPASEPRQRSFNLFTLALDFVF